MEYNYKEPDIIFLFCIALLLIGVAVVGAIENKRVEYRCKDGIEEVKKEKDIYWKGNIVDGVVVTCSKQ